jgi:hypothetical protein
VLAQVKALITHENSDLADIPPFNTVLVTALGTQIL